MKASKEQLAMADVFWRAANECLLASNRIREGMHAASCVALARASGDYHTPGWHCLPQNRLAQALGVPYFNCPFNSFSSFERKQGARYLWLMFVAEGLERGEIEL